MESEKKAQILVEVLSIMDICRKMANDEAVSEDEIQKAKQRFDELVNYAK